MSKKNEKKGLCKINYSDILENKNDIVFLVHLSEEKHTFSQKKRWLKFLFNIKNANETIYLIMSPKYDGLDNIRFKNITRLGKKLNIDLVASATPLMHHGSRRKILDILSAIRRKCTIDQLGSHSSLNSEQRLRSPFELENIFKDHVHALKNTNRVGDLCQFSLAELNYTYPKEVIKGEDPDSILSELTLKGLNEYYSENIPETVLKNVHKELKLIKKNSITHLTS